MNTKYLMTCGHVAQGIDGKTGKPACVICGCMDVEKECTKPTDGLEGRYAKCHHDGTTVNSRWDLPFFAYQPNKEYDDFYCGCLGWN